MSLLRGLASCRRAMKRTGGAEAAAAYPIDDTDDRVAGFR